MIVNLACMPNFSFLGEVEVTFLGWVAGWSDSDDKAISVQLDLTGTELGNNFGFTICRFPNNPFSV